ncbi:autophagy- protein 2 [Arthrobotrys musiformis]|uniref:Autophagy-related protein 2 n=1 Tax=Arthrobotrys musiformis TaxID=47236 RepID=A0AAV9VVY6_9PEZI
MLGYIPRAVQLKLFRYALSKLDFLDHSTYDVERDFNLSLGLRNELEMKNLGLNVTKLSATLNLPPNVRLHDARVSTLHIRIPTDFHRAPVRVSISTVVIDGEIMSDAAVDSSTCGRKSAELPAPDQLQDLDITEGFKIPSGIDLTSSFLQERPTEAKEVDTALQSKFETPENDFEEDPIEDSGLGTPLSFWNFVPSFFQRLVDRVEIAIRDISLRIKVSYPPEHPGLGVDSLTILFSIDSVEIEGVYANSNDANTNKVLSRMAKPGMRAVRIDGVALSLSGHQEFFEDSSPAAPPNSGDTDTVASGSTVLPSAAATENVHSEASQEIPTGVQPGISSLNFPPRHASSTEGTKLDNRHFFAQMQEPNQIYTRLSPSPPIDASQNLLFSPISSFHGSIGSEEIGSGILSPSFSNTGNHAASPQSYRNSGASTTEDMAPNFDDSQNIEPLRGSALSHPYEDGSDVDSLENEPRRFDLFPERNTKFVGVTPALSSRVANPGSNSQVRSRPPELSPSDSLHLHIAEPIPRPAPVMTISQTLTNLELVNASLEPDDEYTYHQEPLDPIEYSNPDLLYLSQSIHSSASPTSNGASRELASPDSLKTSNSIGGISVSRAEPRVIYASSEQGDLSDSGSVYESYPPSEVDEIPSFVSNAPPLDQTSPRENLNTSLLSTKSENQATDQPAEPMDLIDRESGTHPHIQVQMKSDNDQQKVPRATAILMQSRIASPSPTRSQSSASQVEEMGPQARSNEESGSEGSESALAESMIFTHEEAGSLYLSALGGTQSFSPSLSILVEQNETAVPAQLLGQSTPRSMIQKRVLRVDYIDIFVPGIARSDDSAAGDVETEAAPVSDRMSESTYPTMPGAFSVYAASRSERKKTNNPRLDSKAGVSFQLAGESPPSPRRQSPPYQSRTTTSGTRMELEAGNVNISLDLVVGSKIASILTTGVIGKNHASAPEPPRADDDDVAKPNNSDIIVSVASLSINLVDRMPELIAPLKRQESETTPPNVRADQGLRDSTDSFKPLDILVLSMNNIKLRHRTDGKLGVLGSSSEVSLGSCSINVEGQDVMKFVPSQKIQPPSKQNATSFAPVFILRIEEIQKERDIYVQVAVVNFFFPVQNLEAALTHLGGLERLLNTAPAPSLPSKGQASLKPNISSATDPQGEKSTGKKTSIVADIKGINIEVFVSSVAGGIGVSTSPIKISTNDTGGLAAELSQLAVFGPNIRGTGHFGAATSNLELRSISIALDSSPTEEDLERLLKMIMPSTDGYDDDDNVMVDILLRQRRRGSVLRVGIGQTNGDLPDLRDISRFRAVADELAKMATVAKYIPQDERPGMLTLVSVDNISFSIFPEKEPQNFTGRLKNTDICHVAAPSLFALSIRKVDLIRQPGNANELWIGESLPLSRAVSNNKHKSRSMVKIRMIGDEPEPEIKIKIWNTRLEYHAESVFELLSLSTKNTTDLFAPQEGDSPIDKEAVNQSGIHGPSQDKLESPNPPPLRLNLGLNGVSIALNPLNSTSKALFIVHDGSLVCELSSHQPFSASLVLLKGNLVAIDNRNNLASPQVRHLDDRKPKHQSVEDLYHYTSQGYISVLTVTSAKVQIQIDSNTTEGEKATLVNVEDVFIFIESCADSTQTVIGVLSGLKPPLPESEEIKYMTQIMPVDVFANLDENAFVPMETAFIGGQPRDLRSLEEIPEDLFEDEVPFNSQLIESYYPYSEPSSANSPSTLPTPSPPKPRNFHDQVCVIAEEPLTFNDHYIQTPSKEPQEAQIKTVPRKVTLKVCVRNTQLIWNLHDGYDWQKTRDTISKAVKKVEERASRRRRRHLDNQRALDEGDEEEDNDNRGDEESETYDVLFNSIYITLPQHRDPKDLSKDIQNQIKGNYDLQSETGSYTPTITTVDPPYHSGSRTPQTKRLNQKYQRSKRNAMQIELKGVDVDFTIFEPDGMEIQTSLDVRANEVQVTENVRTSTWRMFLTYMREAGVRERGLPMAHIHVDTLRPIPELAATELSIKVKLLPLRLYVDQDALEFLTRFFEFKDTDTLKPGTKQEEPFIQRCEIDTVRVKLDFKPKRVDYAGLRSGRTTEFMNFFILEEADMELRHVALNGVSGFERLGKDLNNIWMPDIKQNQLGGVVAGVAPFRSLVNIGTGVRDLVKVPIMEYRKDGRLVRSIKKGTQHFVKTSGSEVARLGAKIAIGTQTFLERTEEFLVGDAAQQRQYAHLRDGTSGEEDGEGSAAAFSPYADQPLGVYNGLVQAKRGLTRNLNEAKEAIMRVPSEAAQGGSAKGAAAAVFRAAPTAVIRPMIGVTEAVHKTLHGIDNTIDKDKREKTRDKYKKRS